MSLTLHRRHVSCWNLPWPSQVRSTISLFKVIFLCICFSWWQIMPTQWSQSWWPTWQTHGTCWTLWQSSCLVWACFSASSPTPPALTLLALSSPSTWSAFSSGSSTSSQSTRSWGLSWSWFAEWSVDGTDRLIMIKLLVSGWDRSLWSWQLLVSGRDRSLWTWQNDLSVDGTDHFDHDKVIGQWTWQITLYMTKLLVSGQNRLLWSWQSCWSMDGTDHFINPKLLGWTDCFDCDKIIGLWMGQIVGQWIGQIAWSWQNYWSVVGQIVGQWMDRLLCLLVNGWDRLLLSWQNY